MNLLVTGAFAPTESELEALKALGHSVIYMQQEKDSLPCEPEWVEGIIGNGIFLTHPIEKFPALKYIQLTSAGFDRVDMEYVKKNGIKIFNARGVYSIPIAEFAVCGVLELYKKSRFFTNNQENRVWEKHRGLFELFGKRVLIVGCGSVGTECAKRFGAFGCRVFGADLVSYPSDYYEKIFSAESLEEVLAESDIVILTLPLTEKTRHIINKDRLSKMKNGAIIVNIARGGIIDTAALLNALKENLGGAVLDVFETEPLEETSPLWDMENVIITPHNSFVGENNHQRLAEVVFFNLNGVKK